MTKTIRFFLLSIVSLICLGFPIAEARAQSVELRVESESGSNRIAVGQLFYILVYVNNIAEEPQAISSAGGAELVYWTKQSEKTSFSSVNGRVSQSIRRVYAATLLARKKGTYSFGPLTIGGIKSNKVSYTIVESGDSQGHGSHQGQTNQSGAGNDASDQNLDGSQSQNPDANEGPTFIGKGNEKLFMRASVSKTTAYEQEALVYTVKLYTTYSSIKFIGATEAPKFEGFVIEESNAISNQLIPETYQGRTYATAVIARYIIFPQMPGKLKIIGNNYTVSTDAQEYYHDPSFFRLTVRRPIQLNVAPNDLEIDVKALPSPKPANFSGGVGQFRLSSSLKSDKVVANQAGSVTYTVSGQGNLKYIHLPDLNAIYPDEIEVFTPTTDVQTSVGATNVTGSVKFDYSFMPLEQGNFNIPDVELVYFNPATGQYETTVAKGYKLKVDQGEESSKSQATLTFSSKLMPVDVDDVPEVRPYIRGFLYWLWYIIPTVILAGIAIARRKYIAIHSDVIGMRSRRAGKMAKRRLKKAASAMKTQNEDLFYDEILKAIWGYLSDKLRLPTSELTRDNVSQLLESHGMDATKIEFLLKLLDECEFAKYSPASLRKPMSAIYDEATDMLNSLEDGFSKRPPVSGPTDNNDSTTPPSEDGSAPVSKNGSSALEGSPSAVSDATDISGNSSSKIVTSLLIALFLGTSSALSMKGNMRIALADSAYSKGEFTEAIGLYEDQIKLQGATAPLLFNLGCAYYKSGNEGEARLCMERAKKLDPSNARINQNIRYLESRIEDANKAELKGKKGDVSPDNIGFFGRVNQKISSDTSSDTWASFAVMAFILLILSLSIYIFSGNVKLKKLGFFSGLIFLGFSVIFIIFSEMAASHFLSKNEAVITAFKVSLTKDPHDIKSEIGSPLVRGTKVEILESQLNSDGKIGWYRIKLNHSYIGWVDASSVTLI